MMFSTTLVQAVYYAPRGAGADAGMLISALFAA